MVVDDLLMQDVAISTQQAASEPAAEAVDAHLQPGLDVVVFPRHVNTFDGFAVSGRAWGTQLEGATVEVCVSGVTRSSIIVDGLWSVRFEDQCLTRHHAGVRHVIARIKDAGHTATQVSQWVTVDEFVDGYVHIDSWYSVDGRQRTSGTLTVTGELSLGSHTEGRELRVLLLDAQDAVVSTGLVSPGWHHGEWKAALPLKGVEPGQYQVKAMLTDKASSALTRSMRSQVITLR